MPTIGLHEIQELADGFSEVKIANQELKKYFLDLLWAFWNTLYKGYLFDSETVLK